MNNERSKGPAQPGRCGRARATGPRGVAQGKEEGEEELQAVSLIQLCRRAARFEKICEIPTEVGQTQKLVNQSSSSTNRHEICKMLAIFCEENHQNP